MKRPKREIQKRPLAVVLAALPPLAFVRKPGSGHVVIVERGVTGYCPLPAADQLPQVKRGEDPTDAAALNAAIGVTPAQATAMLAGSIFGFHVPAADPLNNER